MAHAQAEPVWTTTVDGTIAWQTITSYGEHLVATDAALTSLDPESGTVRWSRDDLGGLTEETLDELTGSPLLTITGSGFYILDPFSGKTLFDAGASGIQRPETIEALYRTGGLLVAGSVGEKDRLQVVDMADGTVRWTLDEDFGDIIAVEELSDTEMLVVTLFTIYRMESTTGRILWQAATSESAESMQGAGELGALLQGLAEQMAENVEIEIDFFLDRANGRFVIAAQSEMETQTSSGATQTERKTSFMAYALSDGSRLWNEPQELEGHLGGGLFVGGRFIGMTDDGGKGFYNLYEMASGDGLWGRRGQGLKAKDGIRDHRQVRNGLVLIMGTDDKAMLDVVDLSTGESSIDKPVKLKGAFQGLLTDGSSWGVLTTEGFTLVDPTNGEELLNKSIPTSPDLVLSAGDDFVVFDRKRGRLVRIAADGSETEIAPDISFEGKETPTRLERLDDGFVLTSEQNIARIEGDGTIAFQTYFPAPREPGLKRALLYAQAIRMAYVGATSYMAAGVIEGARANAENPDVVSDAVAQGLGMAYQEMGDAASSFAREAFQRANARFQATEGTDDDLIVLTQRDREVFLVQVSKRTGEVVTEIGLGTERTADYTVDEVNGRLVLVTGPSVLAAYDL